MRDTNPNMSNGKVWIGKIKKKLKLADKFKKTCKTWEIYSPKFTMTMKVIYL